MTGAVGITSGKLRDGRAHRGAVVLRADGPNRAGHGVHASQSYGPVLLDLPDGASVHVVSLHRPRPSGLWPIPQSAARPDHGRHRAGMLGGDRRYRARRTRHPGWMFGWLGPGAVDASPAAGAYRPAGALGHRPYSRPGV